jgi:hypothetical protein
MKTRSLLFVLAISSTAATAAESLPTGHPPVNTAKPGMVTPELKLSQKGKVLSIIDVPQYTYLEVTQNKKTLWIAASTVAVKKGDVIRFDDGMAMTDFHSKSLNRTFPSITFVNRVVVTKEKE